MCDIIIHTKCYKNAKFENIDEKWMCSNCEKNYVKKYNPFTQKYNDNEKFYDNELSDCVDSLSRMASILSSCKAYSTAELNTTVTENNKIYSDADNNKSLFSSLFLNIDGNKTNFDSFAVEELGMLINSQ